MNCHLSRRDLRPKTTRPLSLKLGLFNYLARGFAEEPIDWYTRPFWLEMIKSDDRETVCYRLKPKFDRFLDLLSKYMNRMHQFDQPYFPFSFFTRNTHYDFNQLVCTYRHRLWTVILSSLYSAIPSI